MWTLDAGAREDGADWAAYETCEPVGDFPLAAAERDRVTIVDPAVGEAEVSEFTEATCLAEAAAALATLAAAVAVGVVTAATERVLRRVI